jgi:hypothetical protein
MSNGDADAMFDIVPTALTDDRLPQRSRGDRRGWAPEGALHAPGDRAGQRI